MDTGLSTTGYVANGIYDRINGYGNGAGLAYQALQDKETRDEVRKEGDQDANRTGFLAASLERKQDRTDAAIALLSNQISQQAAEVAKCCCETQKLVMSQGEKTRDLINANEVADLRAQLAQAQNACNHVSAGAQTERSLFNLGTITASQNSGVSGVKS